MPIADLGRGTPLVLVPGIQGHWEWMMPAVRALAARGCRVLTFSLGDVPPDPATVFDEWLRTIDALVDRAGASRAAIAGVSFGGLIAYRYARLRPSRVSRLIVVSAPAPRMALPSGVAGYLRHPRLALPVFGVRSGWAMLPEIRAARPTAAARLALALQYLQWPVRRPISPVRMAAWVRAWMETDVAGDGQPVSAPALVVTGEPALDRAVPVSSTLEYLRLVPNARHAVLARTGHIGLVSRPEAFAALVGGFAAGATETDPPRSTEAVPTCV